MQRMDRSQMQYRVVGQCCCVQALTRLSAHAEAAITPVNNIEYVNISEHAPDLFSSSPLHLLLGS